MGTISLEQSDSLYWLGRYAERVYSTLSLFNRYYDRMIDGDANAYAEYCERLTIPNIYKSPEDFVERYLFAPDNPDSIYSNMSRAYDNAIILRESISSLALSYIQMALDTLASGRAVESHLLLSFRVQDDLLAFWGAIDDRCADQERRNILKIGKHLERLDMYLRLSQPRADIMQAFRKLQRRLDGSRIPHRDEEIAAAERLLMKPGELEQDPLQVLTHVERIVG